MDEPARFFEARDAQGDEPLTARELHVADMERAERELVGFAPDEPTMYEAHAVIPRGRWERTVTKRSAEVNSAQRVANRGLSDSSPEMPPRAVANGTSNAMPVKFRE